MTEQIKRIYEAMADKTLSFGCIVIIWDSITDFIVLWFPYKNNDDLWYWMITERKSWMSLYGTISSHRNDIKIIGHPVMYWNVVYWIEKKMEWEWTLFEPNSQYPQVLQELFEKWKDKTKPIEDQPQDCIDFVESLIPKKDL